MSPSPPKSPAPDEPWNDDPFPDTTPTKWSRVRRLGKLGKKKPEDLTEEERETLRADLERFVADYRPAILAVVRVRFPERGAPDTVTDDFLAELCADSKSLCSASPKKSSLRCFLQGWLKNYGPVQQRRDAAVPQHRRGGDIEDLDPPGGREGPPGSDLEEREHREYVRALVRAALAKLLASEIKAKEAKVALESTRAFAVARHNGIPLPGEDPELSKEMSHAELAKVTGIGVGGVKNRITQGKKLFLQFLEHLLRHTVESTVDLRTEWRWFLDVLGRVYPKLGKDPA